MVIFITGATHAGKTALSQRLLARLLYPCVSQDHIKMGLIRSGYTALTPEDDDRLTDYLWPITREMAKTAIENRQNLIIEGCYFPFDWKKDFNADYLRHIRFLCLCMSDRYIDRHFDDVRAYADCIERRLDDGSCTPELLKRENRRYIDGCEGSGSDYLRIDDDYEAAICSTVAALVRSIPEQT